MRSVLGVLRPIELDDQFCSVTGEIRHIWPDWRLSAKVQSLMPEDPKRAPKTPFGVCRAAAQMSRLPEHRPHPKRLALLRRFDLPTLGEVV